MRVKRSRSEVLIDPDFHEPQTKWGRMDDREPEEIVMELFPEAVLRLADDDEDEIVASMLENLTPTIPPPEEEEVADEPIVRPEEDVVMDFVVSDSTRVNDALEYLRTTPGVSRATRPLPEDYPARISALCTTSMEIPLTTLLNRHGAGGDWTMARVAPLIPDKHPGLYTKTLNQTRIPKDLLKSMLGGTHGPRTDSTMPVLKLLYRLYAKRLHKAGMRGSNIAFIITMDDILRLGYSETEVAWSSTLGEWGESVRTVFGVETTPDGSYAIANPLYNLPKKGFGRVAAVPLKEVFKFFNDSVRGCLPEDVMRGVVRFFTGLYLFLTDTPAVRTFDQPAAAEDNDDDKLTLSRRVVALTALTERLKEEAESHRLEVKRLSDFLAIIMNTMEKTYCVL